MMTPGEAAELLAAMPPADMQDLLLRLIEEGADMNEIHRLWKQADTLRDNARRRAA